MSCRFAWARYLHCLEVDRRSAHDIGANLEHPGGLGKGHLEHPIYIKKMLPMN
jgi:hypothetical protein